MSDELSSDFRDLKSADLDGNMLAHNARKAFCYRVVKYIGSYVAAMNGVDNIVFTAGVGENNPDLRAEIMKHFEYLGIRIDEEKNMINGEEVLISTEDSKVKVYVIPTNEELAIARETVALVQ